MSAGNPNVDYARAYARRGIRVFPCHEMRAGRCSCGNAECKSPAKHPRIKDWQRLATTDETQIRKWWTTWPDANIGVACGKESDLLVLDVDGEAGLAALCSLLEQGHELPITPEAGTGSGGSHVYFRHVEGLSNAVRFAPGLDIRTQGGFVVGAGSRNAKGEYRFREGRKPGDVEIQPAPQWLIDLVKAHGNSTNGAKSFVLEGTQIAEGERNYTLYRFGRSLHARGLSYEEIVASLRVVNERRNAPPLDESEVAQIARNATTQPNTPDFGQNGLSDQEQAEVTRLAALSEIAYERERRDAAKRLEVRPVALDKLVNRLRKTSKAPASKGADSSGGAGSPASSYAKNEPWPEPVDGVQLLDEIAAAIRAFVVIGEPEARAAALWVVFTHLVESAQTNPFLRIESPAPQCGKSTLEKVLAGCARCGCIVARTTGAAFAREVHQNHPTLFLDEGDAFLHENEVMRNVLDGASDPDTATVSMCVKSGDEWVVGQFNCFTAICIASIGKLRGMRTVEDRSIMISLKRATRSELKAVGKARRRAVKALVEPLARKCARWAADNLAAFADAQPRIPDGLDGREQDKWEPLIAIGDAIGGLWPDQARQTAILLSGARSDDAPEIELLRALKAMFEGRERLGSKEIVEALTTDPTSRWAAYGKRGKPISERQLANLLRPFGIFPASDGQSRGYPRSDFNDVFERYLADSPSPSVQASQTQRAQGEDEPIDPSNQSHVDTSESEDSPRESKATDTLTGETPQFNEPAKTHERGDDIIEVDLEDDDHSTRNA